MEITAKLKHLRMAPRKVRVVANLIKGLNIDQARAQLRALPKRASGPVLKTLNSAVANAEHNFQLSKDNLYIAKIFVDGGPMLKRWMPRAMGRASAIQKKTSHLTVILGERIAAKAVKKAVQTKQVPETALEKTAAEKIKSAPRAEKKEAIAKERAGGFAKRMFRRKSVDRKSTR